MNTQNNPQQHLDRLIRARYPVIEIVSREERRVQEAVAEIAGAHGKDLFAWTASRGVRNLTPQAEPGEEHEVGLDGALGHDAFSLGSKVVSICPPWRVVV